MKIQDVLSRNIKKRRNQVGLTQTELAEACGISPRAVQEYEYHSRWPGPENVESLAKALKCSVADLFSQDIPDVREPTPQEALDTLGKFVEAVREMQDLPSAARDIWSALPYLNDTQLAAFSAAIRAGIQGNPRKNKS